MLIELPVFRIADVVDLPPADCPAAELPEYEPTLADLAAMELAEELELEDEIAAHLARVNTVCAVEHRRCELLQLRVELGIDGLPVDEPARAAVVLGGLDGVRAVAVDGDAVHAELNGTPRASAVRALVTAGVEVRSAGPRRRLEDAFLQLVGEEPPR